MTSCICATHGHCFDGLASAALFSELFTQLEPRARLKFIACGYGPSAPEPPWGDEENALLDFRYYADERLTFYFDHHETAFRTPAEEEHFRSRQARSTARFSWVPDAVSCASVLAHVAEESFGLDLGKHAELINWANKIDGANFQSAEEASDRTDARLRLVSVVERFSDSEFLDQAVPILRSEGLGGLSGARFVKDAYRRLAPHFRAYEKRVRTRGTTQGRVALVDLTEAPVSVVSKFYHYQTYPQATYSILLIQLSQGVKVSIGYNPWGTEALDVNIGALCAKHGGGGHPYVGAISFTRERAEEARTLAHSLAEQLQNPDPESRPA